MADRETVLLVAERLPKGEYRSYETVKRLTEAETWDKIRDEVLRILEL